MFTQTAQLDADGQRTGLQDSWGNSSYSYDAAGRLSAALYPDGSTEQDQYDALGNRLTLTTTSALSGTDVTASQYDAASELLTSTDTLNGQTTYGYDANGN